MQCPRGFLCAVSKYCEQQYTASFIDQVIPTLLRITDDVLIYIVEGDFEVFDSRRLQVTGANKRAVISDLIDLSSLLMTKYSDVEQQVYEIGKGLPRSEFPTEHFIRRVIQGRPEATEDNLRSHISKAVSFKFAAVLHFEDKERKLQQRLLNRLIFRFSQIGEEFPSVLILWAQSLIFNARIVGGFIGGQVSDA